MLFAARTSHLRIRDGHDPGRVNFVELFFDLVFVFAVTQISHGLLAHLTPLGAVQAALLMVAMWWAWIDTTWIINWLNPERAAVRMMLFVLMLLGLVFSASVPQAFEARALPLALAYVLMQATRDLFMLWSTRRHDRGNFLNFQRILTWHVVSAPFWLAGCWLDGVERLMTWGVAVGIETAGPTVGFWTPGLGRSTTADWVVVGSHMAERCGLFVIIALGESILITGATFAGLAWDPFNVAAFVVAFVGSVSMWLVYFNIGAVRTSHLIETSRDPGRIARSGYTYIHILIVAGIMVAAVGDELVLHHPHGHTETKTMIVILGGPALYLAGNAMFKRLSAPHFPLSHIIGLLLLALLIPVANVASPLGLLAAASLTLVVVAVWEWRSLKARSPSTAH